MHNTDNGDGAHVILMPCHVFLLCLNGNLQSIFVVKVLVCDPEKRRILLSNKHSVVETKLPLICTYEDAEPGMVTEGVVISVQENSLLVLFINNVKVKYNVYF